MKDNTKKQTKILVGVLVLFLVMAVGYALFTETLQINGTASANGNFDLTYTCLDTDIVKSNKEVTASCGVSGNTVTTTSAFTKPSEYAVYKVTITNTGSIPAVLTKVTSPNNALFNDPSQAGDEGYIDMTTLLAAKYVVKKVDGTTIEGDSAVEAANVTLAPGESIEIDVYHSWYTSEAVKAETQPVLPENGASINYNVAFDFQQEVA